MIGQVRTGHDRTIQDGTNRIEPDMTVHPGLTRVRGVRFLLFKVICVLVYN